MYRDRADRELAEQDWQEQEELGEGNVSPLPHEAQEKLYSDLIIEVEAIDRKMATATGFDLDVLQFQKNAFEEMMDAIAFNQPI